VQRGEADRFGAARGLLCALVAAFVVAMAVPFIHALTAPSPIQQCRRFGRALGLTAPAFVPSGSLGRHPSLRHRGVSLRARPLIPRGAAAMDELILLPSDAPAAAASATVP